MKTQHTPGPWTIDVWDYSHANPPRKELNVQSATLLLATVAWDEGKENPFTVQNETAQANARLIAAAPDLLEALQEIAERGLVEGYNSADALRLRLVATQSIARAAIAKATGQTQ